MDTKQPPHLGTMDAINSALKIKFVDNLNIGRKLGLGFGLLIILTITTGLTLFIIAGLLDGMFDEVRTADQLTTLARQINTKLLEMRRDEKNFLLRYTSQSFEGAYGNYVLSNQKHSQEILGLIAETRNHLPQETERQQRYASFLDKLEQAIQDYQTIFETLIDNIRTRGDQKRGLMNDVLELLDHLEAEIDDTDGLELKVAISNLQHAFLSYLRFGLKSTGYDYTKLPIQEHIDRFQEETKRLHTLLETHDELENQAHLLDDIEQIATLFESLLTLDNQIVEQETNLATNARSVIILTERIIANEQERQAETFSQFVTLRQQATILAGSFFLIIILISVVLATIFTRSIATPITALTNVANHIAQAPTLQHWENKIQVSRQDEIGTLTNTFGQMVTSLQKAELERLQLVAIEQELRLARTIQQNLLPPSIPAWSDINVICYTASAHEVGGDLYVYHAFHPSKTSAQAENPKYGLALGDVSGKGTPAALLMAVSVSTFHATVWQSLAPPTLLARMDQTLMAYTKNGKQNCALVYVELERLQDSTQYALTAVNAGCIPPYIKRADGSVEFEEFGGFALGQGLGEKWGYEAQTVQLQTGDMVILTSDGVVEANNEAGEMLGFERLEQIVRQFEPSEQLTEQRSIVSGQNGAKAMLAHLKQELFTFIGQAELHDDMTMMVIQV